MSILYVCSAELPFESRFDNIIPYIHIDSETLVIKYFIKGALLGSEAY
jgi:Flp pilus assembly CpaF family ATPase